MLDSDDLDLDSLLDGFDLDTSFESDFLFAEQVSQAVHFSDSISDWINHPIASNGDSSRGLSLLSSDLFDRGHVAEGSSNLTEESIAQEAKCFTSEIQQESSQSWDSVGDICTAKTARLHRRHRLREKGFNRREPQDGEDRQIVKSGPQPRVKRPCIRLSSSNPSKKLQVFRAFYRLYERMGCTPDARLTLTEIRRDKVIAEYIDSNRGQIPGLLRDAGFLIQPKTLLSSGVYQMGVEGIKAARKLGW